MEVAPTAQRFAYLPISTPSSAAAAAASGMRRSSGFPASPHAGEWAWAASMQALPPWLCQVCRTAPLHAGFACLISLCVLQSGIKEHLTTTPLRAPSWIEMTQLLRWHGLPTLPAHQLLM